MRAQDPILRPIDTARPTRDSGRVDDSELYWLAGLLEGDGTFLAGPPSAPGVSRIRVEMTDLDVVEHAAALFRRTFQRHGQRQPHTKPSFSTTIAGAPATQLMRLIRPALGTRRQAQVDHALARQRSVTVRWLQHGACTAPGCTRAARKRSLCKNHYESWWKAERRGITPPFVPQDPSFPGAILEAIHPGHASALPWLAGLLEGEGTFANSGGYPGVSIEMTDRDVIARAAQLMEDRAVRETTDERDLARGWSRTYATALKGAEAAELMRELRPLMGARRQSEIDRALARYTPIRLTRPPPGCVIPACPRPHRSRGLCNAHYMMWSRDRANGRAERVEPLR